MNLSDEDAPKLNDIACNNTERAVSEKFKSIARSRDDWLLAMSKKELIKYRCKIWDGIFIRICATRPSDDIEPIIAYANKCADMAAAHRNAQR